MQRWFNAKYSVINIYIKLLKVYDADDHLNASSVLGKGSIWLLTINVGGAVFRSYPWVHRELGYLTKQTQTIYRRFFIFIIVYLLLLTSFILFVGLLSTSELKNLCFHTNLMKFILIRFWHAVFQWLLSWILGSRVFFYRKHQQSIFPGS